MVRGAPFWGAAVSGPAGANGAFSSNGSAGDFLAFDFDIQLNNLPTRASGNIRRFQKSVKR
jgi:hypothetical protein